MTPRRDAGAARSAGAARTSRLPAGAAATKRKPARKRSAVKRSAAPARPRGSTASSRPAVVKAAGPLVAPVRTRGFALMAGFLLLALICGWGPPALTGGAPRLWRGYRPVLVRADVAAKQGLQTIAGRLGAGVVSAATAGVEFWDFTGLARVPLSGLAARLDPQDPRFDQYMSGMSRYFTAVSRGTAWDVLYVPVRTSLPRLLLDAVVVLGVPFGGEWRVAELNALETALALASIFAFAVLSSLALREGRRGALAMSVGAALLCTPFVVDGGFASAGIALLLLASWWDVLRAVLDRSEPGDARSVRRGLLLYGVAAAAASLLSLLWRPSAASMAELFGASIALPLLLASMPVLRRSRRRGRNVFSTVPIVRPSVDHRGGLPAAPFAGSVLLVLAVVAGAVGNVPLPTPAFVAGAREFSLASLGVLAKAHAANRLPDVSDFTTHQAYQETLTFGLAWSLPLPDERVTVRDYEVSTTATPIVESLRTVKTFDETWMASVRRLAVPGSLEALLFAQGRPVAVGTPPGVRGFLAGLPAVLAALCLLMAGLLRDLASPPLIRSIVLRFNGVARRNQAP